MVGTGTRFEDWYNKYFADPDGRQPFFINEPYPGYVRPSILKSANIFSAAGTRTSFHSNLRSDAAAGHASMLRIPQHLTLSFRPPSFFLPYFPHYVSLTYPFQCLCTSFRFNSHIQFLCLPFQFSLTTLFQFFRHGGYCRKKIRRLAPSSHSTTQAHRYLGSLASYLDYRALRNHAESDLEASLMATESNADTG